MSACGQRQLPVSFVSFPAGMHFDAALKCVLSVFWHNFYVCVYLFFMFRLLRSRLTPSRNMK